MPPDSSARPARSLADDLRRRDDGALAELVRSRPDIAEPVPVSIAELAARASGAPSVRRAVDALDRDALEVLAILAAQQQPARASANDALGGSPERLAKVLERLWALALVWGPPTVRLDTPVHVTSTAREAVPAAVGSIELRDADIEPSQVLDPHNVDQLGATHALAANATVAALCDEWSTRPALALKAGGLGVRELASTAVALRTDEPTAAFWVELAAAAGLVAGHEAQERGSSASLRYVPTHAFDTWTATDLAEQWSVLASAWLAGERDADAVGGTGADGTRLAALGADLGLPGLPTLRRAVLRSLDEMAPGEALSIESLCEQLEARLPRARIDVRNRVVRSTIREAEQLGVVARNAITGMGRSLLHENNLTAIANTARAIMPPATEEFLAQADLTLVVPGPPSPTLRSLLNLVADLESSGGAAVFRVTPSSVSRILDTGRSPAEIIEELTKRSVTPLPQPMEYLINDVARRHGSVRIGAVNSYLRSDDEALIAAMLSHPQATALGLVRVAPTVVVSRSRGEALVELARELGHAPVAEGIDGSTAVMPLLAHRAPTPTTATAGQTGFDEVFVDALVRALRRAEADSQSPVPVANSGEPVPRLSIAQSATILREAHLSGDPVWLGYADNAGSITRRLVDIVAIDAGAVSAFDHNSGRIRTLAVSRITGVERASDSDKEALG
ncbi:MAG: helicase-associated domain-containing protein [Candidatus Nanopelagicales bacterium]